jgi:hypothetical protein
MANAQAHESLRENTRERRSWAEICARYPNEWVVLTEWEDEHEDEESDMIVSAVVLGHAKTRGESLQLAKLLRERDGIDSSTSRYTGEIIPPDFISLRLLGL